MRLHYITLLLLLCGLHAGAQTSQTASFQPPFDFPLYLSGNFGEIRANHFHGGLDFKTQGVSGKKVLALADGYISRIRVTYGSGYVLDVCYDNGYSTINRHLSGFVSPIKELVEELQYTNESYEVKIIPEKDQYRVKAGQMIAWSGNTGYSFGPHLHLDMFETESDDYVDPLPFFKKYLKDTRAPQVQGFMLFPQPGEGMVNQAQKPQAFATTAKAPIEAWGVIGAGIKAYDYMDEVQNKYGVHTVILKVDGEEVFRSVVDRFSDHENRMINSWTAGQYMKSFVEPGNTLRMLKANNSRGLITINEARDYHFRYTLSDAYGHTTHFSFVVKGTPQEIEPIAVPNQRILRWDKANMLQEPGLGLYIPKGLLYDNVALNFDILVNEDGISSIYQLHDEHVPMHTYGNLLLSVKQPLIADSTKYYIARINKKGKYISVGGHYENKIVNARIRELGTFTLAVDTVPPAVAAVNPTMWAKNGKIVYKVKEEETGIRSYRGTIDGRYALFGLNIMNDNLVYQIDPKRVKRGMKHTVEMTVSDERGNVTTVKNEFTY